MTDSGQIAGFQNLNLRSVYFDTSSWNGLVKSPIREKLIERVQKTKQPVLVSVISAGEVLRIRDPALRERTCRAMLALHGDGPLLDHPLNLARASALAVLHAERDFLLPESGPAKQLRDCLSNLTSPPAREIQEWLENLDCNMQRFLQEIKPPERDLVTEYVSLEVLSREDFLKLLCQFPPARELRLSVPQMRDICMGATFGRLWVPR